MKIHSIVTISSLLLIASINARTVTYPGIGTFDSHDFYDELYRPFADLYLPKSPEECDIEFILYTRQNRHDGEKFSFNDTEQIKKTQFFNSTRPSKMFIHGFLDNIKFGNLIDEFKNLYLENEDINMFIVDWSRANSNPYGQAVVNSRVVGPMIAIQIQGFVREHGGNISDYHLLGHSLGAHVAGYAGKFLKGELGRITGLDPAGPYFEHLPDRARLWHTDAKFVDSIHTDSRVLINSLGLGMEETCSHIDFYPNGGRDQPGCDEARLGVVLLDLFSAGRTLIACSHQRAVDYYMDALAHGKEVPKTYLCDSYVDFKKGVCMDCKEDGSGCAMMGPRAIEYYNEHGKDVDHDLKFFMGTNDKAPYLGYNSLIRIKIADAGGDHHEHLGRMYLKLNFGTGDTLDRQYGQ
ncbi:hypothetical protein RDWZM_000543 [Blomia tropicalis]|uniref:Lipase domain-containing protein n=1 Tax=Blomia tropicalis TaxID=40697 RepID=A0A9Q0MB42_BLOTA|nr:hypothetical protein RDWZM_000543 [Blomia tropicalis]